MQSPAKCLAVLLSAVIFCLTGASLAAGEPGSLQEKLADTYSRFSDKLAESSTGLPLYIESADEGGSVRVEVYGIIYHPFGVVSSALEVPSGWCDIAALHPNVKACTYNRMSDSWQLTLYSGRKLYQPPQDAYRFDYLYRKIRREPDYLQIMLSAEQGPLGTRDHLIGIEAAPLGGGRTFVHFSCSYSYGRILRFAEKMYFATLGRGKVGFSITGKDEGGRPVYVGGPRGAVERNAVRYYLAIQSFIDTLGLPEERRLEARLDEWYDLTSRYRRQLFDMKKGDYMRLKAAEHRNQVSLQGSLGKNFQLNEAEK